MDLPAGLGARLPQGLQETLPIRVVLENGFTAVTAIHDVIDRAGILDSEFAGHAKGLPMRGEAVNKTILQWPGLTPSICEWTGLFWE